MRIGNKIFCFGAAYKLIRNKLRNKKEKIKVAFILQEISLNKFQQLIDSMLCDNRFEVLLLCIPSNIEDGKLVNQIGDKNDTYDYFEKKGYTNLVNTLQDNGKWLSIKDLSIDYIFYNRPYDYFYPEEYRSKNVSKYSRICVLSYGYPLTKDILNVTLNKDFFKNVYYYFAEITDTCVLNTSRFWLTHKFGLQKSKCLGVPSLEYVFKHKSGEAKSWEFSRNGFRIIWTPRWSTDLKIGGSNFFEYLECFLKFSVNKDNVDFLLRPHPLMFKNFVKNRQMTVEELSILRNRIEQIPNFNIDKEKEYHLTFWYSNLLITDISSIIPEYFITGKPIIFCKNNFKLELTNNAKRILAGCYCAENEEEIFEYITNLLNGKDFLKEKRMAIIKELYGDGLNNATNNIIKAIFKDYGLER